VATRSEDKAREAILQIRSLVPQAVLRFEPLDLASLSSVRRFTERVGQFPKVDLLVNNAGVMSVPTRELTEDGFERQFATNYLGPFALTLGLIPALLRSPSPRVTTVTSNAANGGMKRINFEDLRSDRSYSPWASYCQSKLADLMFALELGRHAAEAKLPLVSNACHPGIVRTNLQASGRGRTPGVGMRLLLRYMAQDAPHGALSPLRAATDPSATSGSYYGPDRRGGTKGNPVPSSLPSPALDLEARARLWEVSQRLTGARWASGSAAGRISNPAQRVTS
jgi:NAD(P)-dependent dehydrogenase (short-subunit alcohol dehydrogenase family)